jgi:phosphate transport system protein
MTREAFDQDLKKLQDELLTLGTIVEDALIASVDILKQQSLDEARRLIAYDAEINKRRYKIEETTLRLIATQQPMAGDMRTLAAVLEIVTELERMGDYAKGIAKICLLIGKQPLIKPLVDIPIMADKTRVMLHSALDAFVRRDVELARQIPAQDDEVDNLYNQVYRELLTLIMSNPHNIDQATYLLWVAHNLERAADRVTNICERVIFTVTGELKELE